MFMPQTAFSSYRFNIPLLTFFDSKLKKATSYIRISVEELEYNLEQAEMLDQKIIVRIAYLKSDPNLERALAAYKMAGDRMIPIFRHDHANRSGSTRFASWCGNFIIAHGCTLWNL